ncbi:cell division protein FtsL [Alkalisalibacterium limincola]|uniref:cell division protein FtsL n=1 Tax=Alkalisalibacterium limincola TaxID=2699169 RepID=UPI002107876D|nr:cell division protein FtsL [Alkalisalibacterium limincola]
MSFRLFFLVVLVAATMASAIAVVHARHEHRLQFIELTRLERERDELDIEFGRLQLEQATWADTARIEEVARNRLKMVTPEGDALIVVRP